MVANLTGRFLYRRKAKGTHLNASIATQTNITATHSGWSAYPITEEMGSMNNSTPMLNSKEVQPTAKSVVE